LNAPKSLTCTKNAPKLRICTKTLLVNDLQEGKLMSDAKSVFQRQKSRLSTLGGTCISK